MIGIAVQPSERAAAEEFFELLKTPWRFFDSGGDYDVLISTGEAPSSARAELVLLFGATCNAFDAKSGIVSKPKPTGSFLTHGGRQLPIYGALATFPDSKFGCVRDGLLHEPVFIGLRTAHQTIVRIGYNLFAEVQFLLTVGQPARNAGFATLELHLALLRDLITRAGLPLVEIPPVPAGYQFMTCLTHDIDHPVMRNHRWDHTMFGFLYRAAIVSPINVCRGRTSIAGMLQNWGAAVRLPFVHFGLVGDPWSKFDRYLEIETGLGATYFVIPERDNPGRNQNGTAPPKRACRYSLAEIAAQLKRIIATGNEVSVHGLDAWLEAQSGRGEKETLSKALDVSGSGVRMHWLYFDEKSHALLEEAGYSYDSTVGYNETVGFRAGTAQAYRPLGNTTLLELPLHVMDTALFYPSYLDLSESDASRLLSGIFDNMVDFGGVLTINWHDRSIFPERLWERFYVKLIAELKSRHVWFPTATQAVGWFRKRRETTFESVSFEAGQIKVRSRGGKPDRLPGLNIRIHQPCPRTPTEALAVGPQASYRDVPWSNLVEAEFQQ